MLEATPAAGIARQGWNFLRVHRRHRSLAVSLLATAIVLGPLASARGASQPAVRYLPNVLPRLDLATLVGAAPPGAPMNLTISLAHPDPQAEQAAYQAMYDPTSPAYRHFLTPA